jgi:Flp pilus assembly protein TadD
MYLEPYLELGRAHQERRQHAQSLQTYQKAIRIAPDDPRPYCQAGLLLKESHDYPGAESMLRRAADLAPDDLSIHRQLGALVALNIVHNRRAIPKA